MKNSVETLKTLGLLALAALLLGLGLFVNRPPATDTNDDDLLGKPLFPAFKDPTTVTQLRIAKYDETAGKVEDFEVVQDAKSGLWRMPTEQNYPADAKTQVRDAATSLVDLKVVGVQTDDAKDHAEYGVVEPSSADTGTGEGVGTLVSMRDKSSGDVASLVIGKEVQGMENGRFVRKVGENVVYVVALDPAVFTTEFEKWIEPDVLQLNTFDVDTIALHDYSLSMQLGNGGQINVAYDPNSDLTVRWNEDDAKWEAVSFVTYDEEGEPQETDLSGQEELDAKALNEMKSSLDDLKIVAVYRKPEGLGADLRAQTAFTENVENVQALVEKGFIPLTTPEGAEIKSVNGDLAVELKDGVRYLLRFGAETRVGSELGRYLFVSAEFDESKIAEPALEPLPEVEDPDAPNPERDRIQRENEQKLEAWRKQRREAELKAQDLNSRFADWYYVVSDEVYKKLRFSPAGVIELKEGTATEGDNIDAFRALEEQGLRRDEEGAEPTDDVEAAPFPPGFGGAEN